MVAYVFIQIGIPLAMDARRGPNHSKWTFSGNAGYCSNCLHHMLYGSTCLQLSVLWTIHPEFRPTIHRHLFDVKYFHVYLCYRLIRLLYPRKVDIPSTLAWPFVLIMISILKITSWFRWHRYVFNATTIATWKWEYVWSPRFIAQFRASNILLFGTTSVEVIYFAIDSISIPRKNYFN